MSTGPGTLVPPHNDDMQLDRLMGRMSLNAILGKLVEETTRRLEEIKEHVPDRNVGAAILYTTAADLMADNQWLDGLPLVQQLWSDYGP